MLDFNRRAAVVTDVVENQISGETVILNLNTGTYFGLDQMGTVMWQAAITAPTLQQAYEALLREYDVDAETLSRDFTKLMQDLLDNGLIELQ